MAASKKIPAIGTGVQIVVGLYSLSNIISDKQLSEREKWADTLRLAATTGASVGAGVVGA